MFFKSKKVIGLDIGTSSIKVAELDISGGSASLESFALMATPPNSVVSGEIQDPSQVGATIQLLLSEIKTKRKLASVGLWGTSVIVKKVTIPTMETKMIRDQIRFEAEQYIPFDVNNISLDFSVLSKSFSPDTLDVLLVAAQNEIVAQYVNAVSMAGLKVEVIDVSGFSLANVFEFNYGRFSNETVGLFNFGAAVTNFVVVSGGEIVFCRDIPVGGSNYTNEISKNMGVSLQEAESLKISASSKREVPEEVHSLISATSEAVIDEIKNSLDFLSATTAGLSLNRCYYVGGSAGTLGLIESLSRTTGLQFEHLNCFKKIKVNTKKFTTTYMQLIANYSSIALGLALRRVGDDKN
jgi:type IV pilus assembly protein PilM